MVPGHDRALGLKADYGIPALHLGTVEEKFMDHERENQEAFMLELKENARKRYETIRDYRQKYGISPFEDEKLQERSPQLYRDIQKMNRELYPGIDT